MIFTNPLRYGTRIFSVFISLIILIVQEQQYGRVQAKLQTRSISIDLPSQRFSVVFGAVF